MQRGMCGKNLTWTIDDDGTLKISGTGNFDADQNFSEVVARLIEAVIVAEGATSISDFAFSFCNTVKKISLPTTVKEIGIGAFLFCENLRAIKIPAAVTEIRKSTFCGCWSLTEIELPENLRMLGENSFSNCTSLTAIKIPANVVELGCKVFSGCESLEAVTLPENLTTIGDNAFEGCESLTAIKIPASVVKLGKNVFNLCSSLEKIFYAANSGFEKILSAGNHAQLIPIDNSQTPAQMWHLDGDTLTIIDADKLKNLSHAENSPWYDSRDMIKRIVITS